MANAVAGPGKRVTVQLIRRSWGGAPLCVLLISASAPSVLLVDNKSPWLRHVVRGAAILSGRRQATSKGEVSIIRLLGDLGERDAEDDC